MSHTILHLRCTSLQELPSLQPNPNPNHTEIALPRRLKQRTATSLGAELTKNGQRALKKIHIRVQVAANTFEQKNTDNHVYEIALHADMVRPHHAEDFVEDIADFDVPEGEGAAFDAKDQVLHFEGEDLLVDDCVGLAATFDHQVPGAVAVELSDSFEEVEEIGAVCGVQGGDEAGVDEDELWAVALFVKFGELVRPGGWVVAVRTKLREDGFGDVDGLRGGGGGGVAPEGD